MGFFREISRNHILLSALCAWLAAQILKIFFELWRTKRIKISLLISSGGMPSSHTALAVSASTAIGLKEGFYTPLFALAAVISMVVMYDASGVRRAAGNQARVINDVLAHLEKSGIVLDKRLKEMLGHTPVEVAAGAIVGILTALILA